MMTVCSVCITILDVVYTKLYPVQVSLIIFNHVAPKKIKSSYHDKDNQSSTIITCRKKFETVWTMEVQQVYSKSITQLSINWLIEVQGSADISGLGLTDEQTRETRTETDARLKMYFRFSLIKHLFKNYFSKSSHYWNGLTILAWGHPLA